MASKRASFTRPTPPDLVTCYEQTGRYFKGQRILHPDFGLGTVTQVRREKIRAVMDSDPTGPEGKQERRFLSARLTLSERMKANNLTYEDLDILFEMDLEDFHEALAQWGFAPATNGPDDAA